MNNVGVGVGEFESNRNFAPHPFNCHNYEFYKYSPTNILLVTSFINKTHQAEKKTIIAIFTHPDDETTISPLLTKYVREEHLVYLVIATKGELGVAEHAKIPAGDTLVMTRARAAICACEKLGIKPPIFLGLGDGSLANDFTGKPLHDKLDSILKLYKPDVVITWGPDGRYGHMDHRIIHNIVTKLFQSGDYLKPEQLFLQPSRLKIGIRHRIFKLIK